ncbi:MAG: transcriptional regulator [Candidatus Parabeggiatoa sp. nov. 1]|nr:MAG: transcriptional regulator [Gammaproteobacteria bacterium]
MKTHEEMVAEWMQEPQFKAAYDALEEDFVLFAELVRARDAAGFTQEEVAQRMGTETPEVAKLESAMGKSKHSPTIAKLRQYAQAIGCQLDIKLVPRNENEIQRKLAT